jgi:ligand-binding sensor domain-containing protein
MQNWFYHLLTILIWSSGCCGFVVAQPSSYQFARYSAEKGLSHNQVNCFLKDRQGFVWVGTADGLNRFDGYSFKIFKHDPADSTTIANHYINDLFEDPDGFIWINAKEGYNIYDPATESIDKNADRAARRLGLPDADFNRIVKTRGGDYWISHNRLGLLKYIPSKRLLLKVKYAPQKQADGGNPVISDFNEDREGNLWIVYDNGFLARLHAKTYKATYESSLL